MRYYLDCEFNGMGGELISLALVPENGSLGLYLINTGIDNMEIDAWVAENVIPFLYDAPPTADRAACKLSQFAGHIGDYLMTGAETDPVIITDWPDDIKYFCEIVITGPGTMINVPGLKFEMHRVDAYPTDLPGAVRHNAYWDAMALRHYFQKNDVGGRPVL